MFCMILSGILLFFVYFVPLVTENVVLESESLFRPANGVQSTRSLVEIHNSHKKMFISRSDKIECVNAIKIKNCEEYCQ